MTLTLSRPTIGTRAKSRSMSAYPSLWHGLVWAESPELIWSPTPLELLYGATPTNANLTLADVQSPFGRTRDYNGSSSKIDTGINTITGTSERTVFCVVKCDTPANTKFIASGAGAGAGQSFSFTVETVTTNVVLFRHGSGNIRYGSNLNGWFTFSAKVPKGVTNTDGVVVMINGQPAPGTRNAGTDQTLNTTADEFSIGWDKNAATGYFDGQIGCVYIWNVEKTDKELAILHKDPLALFRRKVYRIGRVPTGNNYTLAVESGSFAVTGTAASLEVGYQVSVNTTSFDFTGTAASLEIGYNLSAVTDSFDVTGTAVTFLLGYAITASTDAFTVSGTVASLEVGYVLSVDSGSFVVTGTDATLVPPGFSLSCQSGSFSVSGTAASLEKGYNLSSSSGSYTVSGTAASLEIGYTVSAVTDSFDFTGTDASLEKGYLLTVATDAFTVTGTVASLEVGYLISTVGGSFVVTGTAATLTYASVNNLIPASGSFTWTGTAATLTWTKQKSTAITKPVAKTIYGALWQKLNDNL